MKKSILFSMLFLISFLGQAQTHEEKIATFIYGFNRLLLWPSYYENKLQVNVLKTSSVADYINTMAKNDFNINHSLFASQVEVPENCNILFVPSNFFDYYLSLASQLLDRPILVVSDKRGCLGNGADVEFYYKITGDNDSTLTYKANINAIKAKNIKTSVEFIGYSTNE